MTESTLQAASLFVGIDVAKDQLDMARSDSNALLTAGNSADGILRIVALLRKAGV